MLFVLIPSSLAVASREDDDVVYSSFVRYDSAVDSRPDKNEAREAREELA